MAAEVKYIRKGDTLYRGIGDDVYTRDKVCHSNNQAKKKSRELTEAGHLIRTHASLRAQTGLPLKGETFKLPQGVF